MLARGNGKLKVPGKDAGSPRSQYTAWTKGSKCSGGKRGVCGVVLNSLFYVLTLNNYSRTISVTSFSLVNHESTPVLVLCVQCCAADRSLRGSA